MNGSMQSRDDLSLEQKVSFLRQPDSFNGMATSVQVVETHMSFVFLTDHFAWKLKKAVKTAYLDFSTIERRRLDCREELRLNRQLAPNVYLDVVPLTIDEEGHLYLGDCGTVVDWLVKMHRLPQGRSLDAMILAGTVPFDGLQRAANLLCNYYVNALPQAVAPASYRLNFLTTIRENQKELIQSDHGLPRDLIDLVTDEQLCFIESRRDLLNQRASEQRIIEAHGDLRPEHIWMTDPPVIIDCLEFNRELRLIDPVSELMLLLLECERLNAAWVADVFLQCYQCATNDFVEPALRNFYRLWHACTRAKLAIWHLKDNGTKAPEHWVKKATAYLQCSAKPLPVCRTITAPSAP